MIYLIRKDNGTSIYANVIRGIDDNDDQKAQRKIQGVYQRMQRQREYYYSGIFLMSPVRYCRRN
jgi:hypothetical protein